MTAPARTAPAAADAEQPPAYVGPGSWTAEDLAGYLTVGVAPRTLRSILARWPHPTDYEAAWRNDPATMTADKRPRPAPPLRLLPTGGFLLLTGTVEYPAHLNDTPSAPLVLFGLGDPAALRPGLAVVGTRAMTAYGQAVATTSVAAAATLGVPIISGAALGVDAAAHEAALAAGIATVAVLATGPDMPYPVEHTDLLTRIVAAGGAIVSEQPFGTGTDSAPQRTPAPLTSRLMARNRIIAGLGAVTVVCEASEASGTMGTVWATLSMGRPILIARPRTPAAAQLPGAQGPRLLADQRARTVEELKALGAPAGVAASHAGRGQLASGIARDRDELTLLVRTSLMTSPLLSLR